DDAAARVRAALGEAHPGRPADAPAVVHEGAVPRARHEIDQLGRELAAAHAGDPWHGPSRAAVLANVGAADAARRPAGGAHSMWEIVLHMTAWTSEVARRLRGGTPAEPAAGDWPAAPAGDAATADAWNAARAALDAAHAELLAALRQLPAEQLEAVVGEGRDAPLGTGVTYGAMVRGLLQHDAYHSGQIAILRRVQRQPDSSDPVG
ncbi:MAG TPA: DinB family protein, partial [Gemmatimonadaceae bacterium]|nr:DinB family protein [Gemmatimonadaceae bacterium]